MGMKYKIKISKELAYFLAEKTEGNLLSSFQEIKKLALENGLLVGISSGANILAAERWIEKIQPSGIVFTILCDRGERYFSCYK